MRYRDAGVDLSRSDALKHEITAAIRSTWTPSVRPLSGGFAGVMEFPAPKEGARLLAATLDGVGTKLHVALELDRVADAAADLVYHGANDLLVHGARPLAFLDYVAQARLDGDVIAAVVGGLARACQEVGAVLLGGETAEMPDTYLPGVVDVAGCMIGSVLEMHVLDGRAARAGDVIVGLASTGLHTNGYSLARRIVAHAGAQWSDVLPGTNMTLGDALLEPHRWYGPAVMPLLERGALRALAHVTGGGIAGNLVRVMPPGVRAHVRAGAWPRPALVRWLIETGEVPEDDARTSFNLGIGMAAVCAPERAASVTRALEQAGEAVWTIGQLRAGTTGVEWES